MKIQILNDLGVIEELPYSAVTNLRVVTKEKKDYLQFSATCDFEKPCHEWRLLETYHEWQTLRVKPEDSFVEKYLVLKFKVIDK